MAKKPRDFAAEYQRRKERGLARGLTGSEARGHKPPPGLTEAAARRQRERREAEATGKLTTPQRQAIRAYARRVAEDRGLDPDDLSEELIGWATAKGYDAFQTERAFIAQGGMIGMTIEEIEARTVDEGFPDKRLYYYHTHNPRLFSEAPRSSRTARATQRQRQRRARRRGRKAA